MITKDKVSEVFMAKLTINRMVVGGSLKKEAILEVADRYGNRFEYNITDSKPIQKMLKKYDADEVTLYAARCTSCGKVSPIGNYCIWCGEKGTCLEGGEVNET